MNDRTYYLILAFVVTILLITTGYLMYCFTPSQIQPTDNDDTVQRSLKFAGHPIELDIRMGDIEGCPDGLFRLVNTGITASKLTVSDPTVDRLTDLIRPYTVGMSDNWVAESLLLMIQNGIRYVTDSEQFGHMEWGQYPCETLFNQAGDCEDQAFLLFALYRNFGFDCVLISTPNHMTVGVDVEGASGNYVLRTIGTDTTRYYVADPCSCHPIGDEKVESSIHLVFSDIPTSSIILSLVTAFGWSMSTWGFLMSRRKNRWMGYAGLTTPFRAIS